LLTLDDDVDVIGRELWMYLCDLMGLDVRLERVDLRRFMFVMLILLGLFVLMLRFVKRDDGLVVVDM
jgi:hypothetical protein